MYRKTQCSGVDQRNRNRRWTHSVKKHTILAVFYKGHSEATYTVIYPLLLLPQPSRTDAQHRQHQSEEAHAA